MKTIPLLALLLCTGLSAFGLTLEEDFRSPPPQAKPHTWWHWMNGNVTKAGITADLEAMAAAGIGGAQIFDAGLSLPAGPVGFCTEEWFECLEHADREARRLGLELCLANCSGWTSSGGPWITPELSMKLVTNTAVRVKGGERFEGRLPLPERTNGFYRDIAVLAFPTPDGRAAWEDFDMQVFRGRGPRNIGGKVEGGPTLPKPLNDRVLPPASCILRREIIDLTAQMDGTGRLAWTAPQRYRDWTVLRVGFVSNGARNKPATAKGVGLECDKLAPQAADVHFDAYIGRVLRRLGPDRALKGVLLDSYEVFGQNWTDGFDGTFAARTGYSIRDWLPVLAGIPVESAAATDRFLKDFRRVISELFVANYAGRIHARCREQGLAFYCEPYGNGPFNDLAYARACDVPMCEFWRPRDVDCDLAALARDPQHAYMACRWGNKALGNAKTVSASAHVWGRRLVGAEAFTAYPNGTSGRWADSPFAMKLQCDRIFADGVNRMIFHRFVHQPWTAPTRYPGMTMAAYGAHFDRTQTWWRHGAKEFCRYIARSQHLLQSGTFVGDVLLCTSGEAPDYGTDGVIPEGYDGDRCHPDALPECRVEEGAVVVPGGVRYRVVGTPPRAMLRPSVVAALERLERAGATVVEYGEVPAALGRLGCAPDFLCDDRDVRWLHRRIGDDDFYFVAVPNREPKRVTCSFRAVGKAVELWDPVSGQVSAAGGAVRRGGEGRTEVTLECTPSHSVFVAFRKAASQDAAVAVESRRMRAVPVEGEWEVSFRETGAERDVATARFRSLTSWTECDVPDIRYFSGTATYVKQVKIPDYRKGGCRVRLDLGEVREIAEVKVNGRAFTALWKPPFVLDITEAVSPGGVARIEIEVTNLWPNRLIGDAGLPEDCSWCDGKWSKGFPLIKEFPRWMTEGKKSPTGRHAFTTCKFWTADEPLLVSGLLGPVRLAICEDANPLKSAD